MRRAGHLIVYAPFAKLDRHEGQPEEVDASGEAILRQHRPHVLERDPFYNPNLSRGRADFSVELSPK